MKLFKLLKKLIVFLLVAITALSLFVYFNPMKLQWCDDIYFSVRNVFYHLFSEPSNENIVGNSSSSSIIDVSGEGIISEPEQALRILENYDLFSKHEYHFVEKTVLPNGNYLFYFNQVINDKYVYAKTQVLVTDSANRALFLINDDASRTYTTDIIAHSLPLNCTLEEEFGKDFTVLEQVECWYDSGDGLIDAYYKKLMLFDDTLQAEVIVQKETDSILSFLSINGNCMQATAYSDIEYATNSVLSLLRDEKYKEIYSISQKNIDGDNDNLVFYSVLHNLSSLVSQLDLSSSQYISIFSSTLEIVSAIPNCNEQLYYEILVSQIESTLINEGVDESRINQTMHIVNSTLEFSVDSAREDEKAINIKVQPKGKRFTHKIDFDGDADIFNIKATNNEMITLNIATDSQLMVELYNSEGDALISTPIYGSQSLSLYPEDGTSFYLRVSSNANTQINENSNYEYTIETFSDEIVIVVPEQIKKTLANIEKAYNTSTLSVFANMCSVDGEIIDEAYVTIAESITPYIDAFVGALGFGSSVDSSKSVIAACVIPNSEFDLKIYSLLADTTMDLEYFQHLEGKYGYIIKAKLRLYSDGVDIYDGFVFFQLEKLEGTNGYYITYMNTESIMEYFGDTPDNINFAKHIVSLFDLVETKEKTIESYTWTYEVLNMEEALMMGHSEEKVKEFQDFIRNKNVFKYSLELRANKLKAEWYTSWSDLCTVGKNVYDITTDPVGTILEKLISEEASDAYTGVGVFKDIIAGTDDSAADILEFYYEYETGTNIDEMVNQYTSSLNDTADYINREAAAMEDFIEWLKEVS